MELLNKEYDIKIGNLKEYVSLLNRRLREEREFREEVEHLGQKNSISVASFLEKSQLYSRRIVATIDQAENLIAQLREQRASINPLAETVKIELLCGTLWDLKKLCNLKIASLKKSKEVGGENDRIATHELSVWVKTCKEELLKLNCFKGEHECCDLTKIVIRRGLLLQFKMLCEMKLNELGLEQRLEKNTKDTAKAIEWVKTIENDLQKYYHYLK